MTIATIDTSTATLNPDFLPTTALYQPKKASEGSSALALGWNLAKKPFALSNRMKHTLTQLGPALWQFQTLCDTLYTDSLNGKRHPFIAQWLNQGKPDALIKYSAMKRFKHQRPVVIRPDLLITEGELQLSLTELDSVPGGMGFTSALNHAYARSGFDVVQDEQSGSMPLAFWNMLESYYHQHQKKKSSDKKLRNEPTVALIVSNESEDYIPELSWLVEHLRTEYNKPITLVRPQDISLQGQQLCFTNIEGNNQPIDFVYRFFELFDLPNIANIELIQFAIKKGLVVCTPPFKSHLEEKLWLGLFHHPALKPTFKKELGSKQFDLLERLIPPTWILDPAKLPAHAVIPNLAETIGLNEGIQSFEQLKPLTQKQRELVIKPSGFSELAWGSKGVVIGHDISSTEWAKAIDNALAHTDIPPHILQTYRKPARQHIERHDLSTQTNTPYEGRTRLCPYYFVSQTENNAEPTIRLSGILATTCPANKKIIHGMQDAILSPATFAHE